MAEEESTGQDDLQYVGCRVPVDWIDEMDRLGRVRRWKRAEVIREAIRQFVGIPDDSHAQAKAS